MSALRIKNTSESDARSHEVTKAVTNKSQKKTMRLMPLEPHNCFWALLVTAFNSYFMTASITFTCYDTVV